MCYWRNDKWTDVMFPDDEPKIGYKIMREYDDGSFCSPYQMVTYKPNEEHVTEVEDDTYNGEQTGVYVFASVEAARKYAYTEAFWNDKFDKNYVVVKCEMRGYAAQYENCMFGRHDGWRASRVTIVGTVNVDLTYDSLREDYVVCNS